MGGLRSLLQPRWVHLLLLLLLWHRQKRVRQRLWLHVIGMLRLLLRLQVKRFVPEQVVPVTVVSKDA